MIKTILRRLKPLAAVLMFMVALGFVHHKLRAYTIDEIFNSLRDVPLSLLVFSMGLTAVNYSLLIGYDLLALHYLRKKVPLPKIAAASLIGFSISNNTGYALLSGSSVRYRFYTPSGLSGLDIITCAIFSSVMYFLGTTTLFSMSVLTGERYLDASFPLAHLITSTAWALTAVLLSYWLLILRHRKPVSVRGMEISLPSPSITWAQTLLAATEQVMAALVLYVLIGYGFHIPFHHFLIVFLAAQVLGLFSQVPGGLGVFEGAFLHFLGTSAPTASVVAALLIYRVVYYFLPLLLAGAALLTHEVKQHHALVTENAGEVLEFLTRSIPQIFSLLLMLAGGVLLVSGATPTNHEALTRLVHFLPLAIVETSHLSTGIVGLLLLFMARAVRLRLDVAYAGVLLLLALGAVLTFLKGFDWQEALALIILFALFLPTKSCFTRKTSLLGMSFSPAWMAFTAIVLMGVFWIGLFSYRHVEYTHQLWWTFSYQGDAHRFLRSSLTLILILAAFASYRLLRVKPEAGHLPKLDERDRLGAVVPEAAESRSYLALLGDKYILWHESGNAFIMYGKSPGYWIAMGDPVGTPAEQEDLAWQFLDLANKNGARIAFYQVSKNSIPIYLDLGLILIKMGEEARVPLQTFGLEGGARSSLRQINNKFTKKGFQFVLLEKEDIATHMEELKQISNAWLTTKHAEEKGFSLGSFSEEYLVRTRIGAISLDNKLLAFANLWELSSREEISSDLMRYLPEAPGGIMEYLFIQLMMWAKTQNYTWFNIGMAPLAGLEKHPLAPLWHKIGNIVFEHGETFYNFEGLHAYKEKFDPVWEPRYLAAPPLHAPAVLLKVTTLISGSLKGVFKK